MPKQKDLKRLVRARMQKTGESYTAARARLLEKRPSKARSRGPARAATPAALDWAALAGTSDATIAAKTGHSWAEWVELLDRAGAPELGHTKTARLVHEAHGVPGWWSQTVVVGYERIRGLREKGQRLDGSFEVTKSKTYPAPLAELWIAFVRCERWLDGAKLRMSKATKPKVMRMRWEDGTPVEAYFTSAGAGKSRVQVAHRKLASRAEAERLKTFWSAALARLGAVLTKG